MSRPKRTALDADVAAWVAGLQEDCDRHRGHDPIEWPSWKRLPDFLEDRLGPVSSSTAGWRFYADGRIEIVTRGS
jgi:hypothetical protein